MKIQLVGASSTISAPARVPFSACPLCAGESFLALREVDASNDNLLAVELESHWQWNGCETCGHLFTSGYFDKPTFEALHSRPRVARVLEPDFAVSRRETGEIVHRIAVMRGTLDGTWLDVGCGKGALLMTAHEFGYDALGIDARQDCVHGLREQGYQGEVAKLEQVEGQDLFDVISFFDSFDGVVFPAQALQAAQRLLRPGGVLSIRVPNVDSRAWHELDAADNNPYWSDPERFHNFSREHLYWLLRRNGFEPCDFMVSSQLAAGMVVCATLSSAIE